MFRAMRLLRPDGPLSISEPHRGDVGLRVLVNLSEPTAVGPATSATWAWTLRRFGRWMVIGLPGYALVSGLVSLNTRHRGASGLYLPDGRPLHLVAWVLAAWIGLMGLLALAALLAATRTRRTALLALMASTAGLLAMLPFAGLPGQTGYGAGARWYVLAGATVYTAGWVLAGSAVALSGVLNFGDGVLLMFAAPLLGVVGLLVDPLQTIGAVLVFAAGIGIAVRAGRLLPVGRRGIAAAAAAQAVAAATAAPEKVATASAVTAAASEKETTAASGKTTTAASERATTAAAGAGSNGAVGQRSLAAP